MAGVRKTKSRGSLRTSLATLVVGVLASGGFGLEEASAEEDVFSYKAPNGVIHFTNVPTNRKFRSFSPPAQRVTKLSLKPTVAPANRWNHLRVGKELREMIANTANRFDLEPALVHAVVRAESGFNPRAVSSAGARGLMQLMPETALEVGVRDVFHPQDNLDGGVSYLRGLLDRYSGNVHLTLAASRLRACPRHLA